MGASVVQYCMSLTEIHYDGTMEEWGAITKYWDLSAYSVPCTIYCTDGEIKK